MLSKSELEESMYKVQGEYETVYLPRVLKCCVLYIEQLSLGSNEACARHMPKLLLGMASCITH